MATDAFTKVWLRTDTYIDNLSPGQRRSLRALCEKFFEAGRKMPEKGTPKPESGTTKGATHERPSH